MGKVLFWDFDGTLVLSDPKWSAAFREVLDSRGIPVEEQDLKQRLRRTFSWNEPDKDYVDATGEHWWRVLLDKFAALYSHYGLPARQIGPAVEYVRGEILNPGRYQLFDGAEKTLRECLNLGWRNYILSNNFPELESIVDALGVSGYFSGIISSANVGYEKPRPEIFRAAMEMARSPRRCVMIGDNPVADIEGGCAAGMTTILVHVDTPCDADYTCASLREIPAVLEGLKGE